MFPPEYNQLESQSLGNKTIVNAYDKVGRLTSKKFGDEILTRYSYDELDRRVTGRYFDVLWKYGYDQYNQLISATNNAGGKYLYTYDAIGNRVKSNINGKEEVYTNNKFNQIANIGYEYDANL